MGDKASRSIAEILKLCEQRAATSTAYGSHSMAYEDIADMLRSAVDFDDPDKRGVLTIVGGSVSCQGCGGSGSVRGPRGGQNRCQHCYGNGRIHTKGCPKCDYKVTSDSYEFQAQRCPKCEAP